MEESPELTEFSAVLRRRNSLNGVEVRFSRILLDLLAGSFSGMTDIGGCR